MRHRKRRGKLSLNAEHRKALLRNLVKSLVERKRIRTTLAKAKSASAFADQMVTLAKRGAEDLHARRQIVSKLACPKAAATLIKDIAPHFKERQGGYTRVLKLGQRSGDASEMAILEFTAVMAMPAKPKKPKKEKESASSVKSKQTEKTPEKGTKKSGDAKPSSKATTKEDETSSETAKEVSKRGGFLGTLRKFLKGDEK